MSTAENNFRKFPFTETQSGYQEEGKAVPQSVLECFQLFFTDELLQAIVSETNRFAAEKLAEVPLRQNSMWKKWYDVTLNEMKAFLGVLLNMGLNSKPEIKDYFSKDWLDCMPFFSSVFTRTRYLQIFWMLHVNPPSTGQTTNHRGQKVENVVSYLNNVFLKHFLPGKDIAIDECTIGFKGRVAFKTYNPQKPTKWGLRVYALADCETGYLCSFEPYYGSHTTEELIRPDLPFTARIVLHLCEKLLQRANRSGYHLYTDRFYTGCDLAMELYKKNIHITGTVMSSRKGMPPEVRKMKLKTHEVAAFTLGNKVMVLGWQDKRQVLMLNTYHDATTESDRQKRKGREKRDIQKPKVIIDYTKKMGAVDRADHYYSSYTFARKTLKWWRKLFFWLIEVAVVNSFILDCHIRQSRNEPVLSHIKYRKGLIQLLVGDVRNAEEKRGRTSSMDKQERLDKKQHFLGVLDEKQARDCTVCSDRKTPGERKRTIYFCKTCKRNPGLHPTTCFEKYHTEVSYRS